MIIKKIVEEPFRKYSVKKLPKDAEERGYNINNEKLYYSKLKQSYYVVIE